MVGSGTEPGAIRAKTKLSREFRAKGRELRDRLREYRRCGEFDEAIAYLQSVLREGSYPDRVVFEHLAQVYSETEQFDRALAAVKRTIELGDTSPETELQLALLEARAGNTSQARHIFAKVTAASPEWHHAKFEYGCFLCEQGELRQGTSLIDRAIELDPEADQYRRTGAKRLWSAADRFWNAGERTEAIACAEKASELAPEHVAYHLRLAQLRFKSGDKLGAISGLKSAAEQISELAPEPVDAKDLIKMVATLQSHGELHAAWRVLEKIPSDRRSPQKLPYIVKAQRLRSIIKYFQGDIAAARREALAWVRLLDSPMLRLPLTELLDECLRQARADDREPALAKWLWPKLNLPESRRQDWLLRLRWGLLVNRLMSHWIPVNRERLSELDDLVERPDWSPLAAAREEGKPIVLTGLHLGPQLVAVHYIDRLDHPLLMVAGSLTYALTVGSKPFLSTSAPHNMVKLRDSLASFGTVYLAGDGRGGRSRYPAKFLGSTVFLREGAAALARLGEAQTFLCAARWSGHRIKLDLVQGPAALKDESRKAWNERWFSFLMNQFESHLLAGPENIRTNSLWFVDQP